MLMQITAQEEHMIGLRESFIVVKENVLDLKRQAVGIKTHLCDLLIPISADDNTEVTGTNCSGSQKYPVANILECDRRLCTVREIIQDLNGTCHVVNDNNELKSSIDKIIANNCDRRRNLEDRLERFDKFVDKDKEEKSEIATSLDELDVLHKKLR